MESGCVTMSPCRGVGGGAVHAGMPEGGMLTSIRGVSVHVSFSSRNSTRGHSSSLEAIDFSTGPTIFVQQKLFECLYTAIPLVER